MSVSIIDSQWFKTYIHAMSADRIEKTFWFLLVAWFILRTFLLGSQYFGTSDIATREAVLKHFSQGDIDAGRNYAMAGFWFKAIFGVLYLGILIYLLKLGFFSWLFQRTTALAGEGLWRNDALFIIGFLLLLQLLNFPATFYFGYWREAEAGFANIGLAGWLIRFGKSMLISISLEAAGILLLIAVLRWFPQRWPLVVPGVMGLFGLLITLIFPVVITPLFYEQKPLPSGEFREKLLKMAQDSGMQVDEIFVVDESRYSKHTNAYFTGVGRFRRIVLYDNLINSHTPDEAALIFAHEAGHWQHNHVAWGLSLGILGMAFLGVVYYYAFPFLATVPWFGLRDMASSANLPFLMVVVVVFQLFTAPIESQISQLMERQADYAALKLTGLREVYIAAQVRLSRDNRSDLLPSPFRVFWLYSHPPAHERIKMAEEFFPGQ